ncbi:MAG TPA: diguanylate cyclase [Tepidisphaeraceae bacterium]|jgi:diguanylate cyclase (GGDEF)-like protein
MPKHRLLIIEDDADQRELIRETLEDYFGKDTCTGVGSLADALAQDLASFDLILSDYNLPDSSSMQLVDQIRKRCQTPVILVTGENACHLAAEAIRKGATDYIVKMGDYLFTIPLVVEKNLAVDMIKRENEKLRSEIEKALEQVREKNLQLEQSLKKMEEMAATDALTGLYNRRHFGKALEQCFAEAQRYGKDLSCVMIDLDSYKKLNDTYGHQVGDQLLMLAGRVMTANKRAMDIAARYGGDEFVLLLPHASGDEAAAVAQRIREEFLRSSAQLLKREQGVTMSIGVGSLNANHPTHADQLVSLADAALYQAKDAGRNRISMSTGSRTAA